MADGSNYKQVGFYGSAVGEPTEDHKNPNTTTYVSRQGNHSNFHQKISDTSYVDPMTGAYVTSKEVVSTETSKDGSAGRVVTEDEHYTKEISGPGGKSGYSEYHVHRSVHKSVHTVESANYGDGSASQGNYGNKGHYSGGY